MKIGDLVFFEDDPSGIGLICAESVVKGYIDRDVVLFQVLFNERLLWYNQDMLYLVLNEETTYTHGFVSRI